MKYRILGATGISVSEITLGTMMLGAMGNTDHDDSIRIIHKALDEGINFIDTADVYSMGESEEIVGKALKGRRDHVILATKFGFPMGSDVNQQGGSARWIKRAVEDSLRRLGTDYIDLYQIHRPDYYTDINETLSALSDLIHEGKVRAIGSSTFPAEAIVEAQWAAQQGGHHRFLTEQPMYSIFTRKLEGAVLPTAQRYRMGVLTYSPLNGGWLSGRMEPHASHRAKGRPSMYDATNPVLQPKVDALRKITALAEEAGIPLPHLALAFVRSHSAVSSVIIGPRKMEQLESLLSGADVDLSDEILDRIDEIVPPGTDINPADNYAADHPALANKRLRRR
ncbi:aldo/keto reductase [Paenibacillus radicis (ex Gao et al. 2016)]|uniref:Aldo/keto reductase n=1 Tax=Paenibacillus radicis (ex Gao et al. 2016) TaxID=1737354 RepID=A0A917HGI9_9BACL|nr:aldo/keto reductase [Paenibacillus radicis (ex Gao et al. 2016)]GGG78801.1 aldo/keto reductase [Paenibacillus radicis (ex Gao et al. 2016)]